MIILQETRENNQFSVQRNALVHYGFLTELTIVQFESIEFSSLLGLGLALLGSDDGVPRNSFSPELSEEIVNKIIYGDNSSHRKPSIKAVSKFTSRKSKQFREDRRYARLFCFRTEGHEFRQFGRRI